MSIAVVDDSLRHRQSAAVTVFLQQPSYLSQPECHHLRRCLVRRPKLPSESSLHIITIEFLLLAATDIDRPVKDRAPPKSPCIYISKSKSKLMNHYVDEILAGQRTTGRKGADWALMCEEREDGGGDAAAEQWKHGAVVCLEGFSGGCK
ncbi:unnamed protein product [Striga asiatica]|uniref:Uncharacterized protein n=1 Tax=Striga asiatica TaxID=4170 RepID=A0A5A7QZ78_STRAF|nr:unnamed protein product [Striga asiatica]